MDNSNKLEDAITLLTNISYTPSYMKKTGWDCCYYDAMGKHYLQYYLGEYYSAEEFEEIMTIMGIKKRKNNRYLYRPNKNWVIKWV
tara:strand:+ start:105 stop:362 length:258 start_codon:yes stop_codon:yes gene_type:complete